MLEKDYTRRGVAEFIGTFALVFIGAGSLIYSDVVVSAFAHGLVIAVMVSSFAAISGGHFNPAITVAYLVTRRIAALARTLLPGHPGRGGDTGCAAPEMGLAP